MYLLFGFICMLVWVQLWHMCAGGQREQGLLAAPSPEVDFQVIVSCLIWALWTKKSSARTEAVHSRWAVFFVCLPGRERVDTQEAVLFSDFCGKAAVGLLPMSASMWQGHLCSGPAGRRVTGLERKEVHASRREGNSQQADGGVSIFNTSELRAGLLWKRALEVDRAGGPGKGQCPGKMKSRGMALSIWIEMPVALSFPFLYGMLIKSKDISTPISGMRCPCAGEQGTVGLYQHGPDYSKPQRRSPSSSLDTWWERWPWRTHRKDRASKTWWTR